MAWLFGGWPPPPPAGGSVTFAEVRDALAVATSAVPFNFQAINQIASVNALELVSSVDNRAIRLGQSGWTESELLDRITVGFNAGGSLQVGATGNIVIGSDALSAVTTGADNVVIGHGACVLLDGASSRNVCLGNGTGASATTESDNTFIGNGAGGDSTGSRQILIGSAVEAGDPAADDELNIGGYLYAGLTGGGLRRYRFGGSGPIAAQAETMQVINAGADTVPVLALTTTGANGAKASVYVGDRDPSGAVAADSGSYYLRVEADNTSALYLNRSAGAGTSWSLVTAVP